MGRGRGGGKEKIEGDREEWKKGRHGEKEEVE